VPEPFATLLRDMLAVLREHQYVTLFFVIAIEEAGVPLPVPGDLIIAYYGWRASGDPIELAQVIVVCALASTAGTLGPYALALRFGHNVATRVTGWLDIDTRRVDELMDRVQRYGFRGVLIGRLIPGLRVAVSLVAGTARVPIARFSPGVCVAAAIYWTGWALLGAIVGPRVVDVVSPTYLGLVVILIPIILVSAFVGRVIWARARRHS
jgi:membrane protein DedA with SNARE-associated domain